MTTSNLIACLSTHTTNSCWLVSTLSTILNIGGSGKSGGYISVFNYNRFLQTHDRFYYKGTPRLFLLICRGCEEISSISTHHKEPQSPYHQNKCIFLCSMKLVDRELFERCGGQTNRHLPSSIFSQSRFLILI